MLSSENDNYDILIGNYINKNYSKLIILHILLKLVFFPSCVFGFSKQLF